MSDPSPLLHVLVVEYIGLELQEAVGRWVGGSVGTPLVLSCAQ